MNTDDMSIDDIAERKGNNLNNQIGNFFSAVVVGAAMEAVIGSQIHEVNAAYAAVLGGPVEYLNEKYGHKIPLLGKVFTRVYEDDLAILQRCPVAMAGWMTGLTIGHYLFR